MPELVALALVLAPAAAWAASAGSMTASGPSGLALAAVVAQYSPALSPCEKSTVARLFDGENPTCSSLEKISVTADKVVCRTSNVDIAARSCEVTFKNAKKTVKGRAANEIFATAAVAGVTAEGAAGSNFESFSNLMCTVDPREISQKSGGGADCSFNSGQ